MDAAKLAKLLYDNWESLQGIVYQIRLSSQPTSTAATPDFDLADRGEFGQRPALVIHWGRAPGRELAGEPTADSKLEKLKKWANEAKLAKAPMEGEIDLRSIRALSAMRNGRLIR
jgi:hypothetical protein